MVPDGADGRQAPDAAICAVSSGVAGIAREVRSPGNADAPGRGRRRDLAERVGFEPTVRRRRTPDFESGAFDHSATSPEAARRMA